MENMAQIVNSTPNAAVKIQSTKYKIQKCVPPAFKYEFYIQCKTCKNYVNASNGTCCATILKNSTSDHFVIIPVMQQIEHFIRANINDILTYNSFLRNVKDGSIHDLHNGEIYQNALKQYPNSIILPLIVNTDGVKVFNSSTKSLWLIQLSQAYLPPKIRYVQANILIAAAHFGQKKIDMNEFFLPLLKELHDTRNKGGLNIIHDGSTLNFMPLILCSSCDMPAKADLQGMVGHNGRFACSFCYHPGVSVKCDGEKKAIIRYVKSKQLEKMRSHEDFINIYDRLRTSPISGLKKMSCMVAADCFDLVYSFSIDTMHCVYLGVIKKLFSLWLDTKNHQKPYYIKKQSQINSSNRLVSIKPISDIIRKPRSIFARGDFKANEYRSLLLYYLRFALPGNIEMKYIKHFQLLSSAIYLLSRENVSVYTIEQASIRLNTFVDTYEDLYGKNNVTMNLHLIRHLTTVVRKLGPLWVHSAFAFESNNGVVVSANTSKTNILQQLAWKYVMKQTLKPHKQIEDFSINGKKVIKISDKEKNLFEQQDFDVQENRMLVVYKSIEFKGIKYASEMSKDISTIDYFVRLKDNTFGSINFYTVFDYSVFAIMNIYISIGEIDHFTQVKRTEQQKLIKLIDIADKLLYLKFGFSEYITTLPNKYEKT